MRARYLRWCGEPYRVFFPLAILNGIVGVLLWPLFFADVIPFYPGMNHTRMMAFGFFGGLVLGFLGTALPRLLSVSRLSGWELGAILMPYVGFGVAHTLGATVWGEGATVVCWLLVLGCFTPRIVQRADLPPPGFVLVALGVVCAVLGGSISIYDSVRETPAEVLILRQLLEFQGFLFLPVMGAGAFILPRMLGLPERQDFPKMRWPTREWSAACAGALLAGIVVLGSFWLEVRGHFVWAYSLRFLAVAGYLSWQVPWFRASAGGTVANTLRLGLGCLALGLLLIACFPAWRVAFLHLSLGIGFVLVAFMVAARVVYGHGDRLAALAGTQRWIRWVSGLVVVAVTSRMIGDFIPKIMVSHYVYGAVFWAVGAGVWGGVILRNEK